MRSTRQVLSTPSLDQLLRLGEKAGPRVAPSQRPGSASDSRRLGSSLRQPQRPPEGGGSAPCARQGPARARTAARARANSLSTPELPACPDSRAETIHALRAKLLLQEPEDSSREEKPSPAASPAIRRLQSLVYSPSRAGLYPKAPPEEVETVLDDRRRCADILAVGCHRLTEPAYKWLTKRSHVAFNSDTGQLVKLLTRRRATKEWRELDVRGQSLFDEPLELAELSVDQQMSVFGTTSERSTPITNMADTPSRGSSGSKASLLCAGMASESESEDGLGVDLQKVRRCSITFPGPGNRALAAATQRWTRCRSVPVLPRGFSASGIRTV